MPEDEPQEGQPGVPHAQRDIGYFIRRFSGADGKIHLAFQNRFCLFIGVSFCERQGNIRVTIHKRLTDPAVDHRTTVGSSSKADTGMILLMIVLKDWESLFCSLTILCAYSITQRLQR